MIKVLIGTNTNRDEVIISENTTLKQALQDNHVEYSVGQVALDGATLKAGDLNKTFKQLGVVESCFLVVTVKSDGGSIA